MTTDPAPDFGAAPQPQPDALDYKNPYTPARDAPVRPTSVTTIAIIGIILGAGGLLCKPLSLVMFVVPMPVPNPVVDAFKSDSFLRLWMVLGVGVGWLVSLLLLMSSIGSLRLKDWARGGMLAYAALAAVMTVVTQVVGMIAVQPAIEQAVRQATGQAPGAAMPMQMSPAISLAIGMVLGLWFPVVILWYYTRPRVKEAFGRGPAPAGAAI
jgi:hypothetical protein